MTKWKFIPKQIYSSIYAHFRENLTVMGTITDMEGTLPGSGGKVHLMTEWGFKDADYPLLKYEKIGTDEMFFISAICES